MNLDKSTRCGSIYDERRFAVRMIEITQGIISRYAAFVRARALFILLAALVVTVLSGRLATELDIKTNLTSLMPDGVSSVDNIVEVSEKLGSLSTAMVVVDSPDSNAALRFLGDLQREVVAVKGVRSAAYSEDLTVLRRHRLLFVDGRDLHEIRQRVDARIDYEMQGGDLVFRGVPVVITIRSRLEEPPPLEFDDIFDRYGDAASEEASDGDVRHFQSEDGRISVLVVWLSGSSMSIGFSRKVLEDLERTAAKLGPATYHPELTVEVGGRLKNRVVEFDAVMADLKSTGLISGAAILLVLIGYFRKSLAVVYIGLPLFMSLVWTFGLTALVLGNLNLVTVFLGVILFGLGADFGIHNLARYEEARRDGASMDESLTTMMTGTGKASLLAAVTTIAGFFSLLLTDFRAFSEFGFIAGSGTFLAFMSMYTVFPALVVSADRAGIYKPGRGWAQHSPARASRVSGKLVLLAVGILTILAAFFASKVEFEEDFSQLRAKLPEHQQLKNKIAAVFPLRSDKAVVAVDTLDEVAALVDAIEAQNEADPTPTIDRVRSIYTVVPRREDQLLRLVIIEKLNKSIEKVWGRLEPAQQERYARLRADTNIGQLEPENLPPALQQLYLGSGEEGGFLVYIYNRESMLQAENARAFAEDIRSITVADRTYHPATEAIVFVDMLNLMIRDAGNAVFLVLATIFVALIFVLGGFVRALIVLVPTLAGFLFLFGIMGAFGLKLSIFNMVALPAVLGIGIDNSIHIFHRYQEEGIGSLAKVVWTTGGAAIVTTLTTIAGFAGMIGASNQGLNSLGIVACVGLACCMLLSLFMLPALLRILEQRRSKVIDFRQPHE